MKKKRDSYWIDGFSIDETRVSTLILLIFIFSGIGIWSVIKYGDIPTNLVNVIIGLITAIAGINIAEKFATRNTTTPTENTYPVTDDDNRPTI